MTLKLTTIPHWPYVAMIPRSKHGEAAKRAIERFERAERRLRNGRPDPLHCIEQKASDIVKLADEMLEEEHHEQGRGRGKPKK